MTKEEAAGLVQEVDKLRESKKMTVADAAKEIGHRFTAYYLAKNMLGMAPIRAKSRAERMSKVQEANRLVGEGMNRHDACNKAGIKISTYYHYRKKEPQRQPGGLMNITARLGLSPHSLPDGRLAVNCPLCNPKWELRGRNPRELNNQVTRHFRNIHPGEQERAEKIRSLSQGINKALAQPPLNRMEDRGTESESHQSFACPHCGTRLLAKSRGNLEVFVKISSTNPNNGIDHE